MYREEHIYVYVLYIYYISIYNRFGTICGFGHPRGSWNVAQEGGKKGTTVSLHISIWDSLNCTGVNSALYCTQKRLNVRTMRIDRGP